MRPPYPLQNYHTFGCDVRCQDFVQIESIDQALSVFKQAQQPYTILGGGSNVIFDGDYPGLIILNRIQGIEVIEKNSKTILLKIGAGENWHAFVLYCQQHQYYGVENLSLIPGTVGAAPIQNIGAYGQELKNIFVSLEALEISSQTIQTFDKQACQFDYRNSFFKKHPQQHCILNVTLELSLTPQFNLSYPALQQALQQQTPTLNRVIESVIAIRQSKLPDPSVIGNAGSFFKNPIVDQEQLHKLQQTYPNLPAHPFSDAYKLSAAWLIEQAGLKGYRTTNCGVYDKHALVLVNYGDASSDEILQLAQHIQQQVFNLFAIKLEFEVRRITT